MKKIVVAYRRRRSFRYHSKHAYPAGAYFCAYKSRQNTLGALPQDPCRWLCWIRIDLRREPKINPYCAQNRSQGSYGRICPYRLAVPEKIFALFVCSIFSTATDSPPRFIRHRRRSAPNPPTPFPEAGKGLGWVGEIRAAVRCSGNVRACREPSR